MPDPESSSQKEEGGFDWDWVGLIGFMLFGTITSIAALIHHLNWLMPFCLLGGTFGMCQFDEHYPHGIAYKRRQEAKRGNRQGDGEADLDLKPRGVPQAST